MANNGTEFENTIKDIICKVLGKDDPLDMFDNNICIVEWNDFIVLYSRLNFDEELKLRSYLVKQPRYTKGTGKEGRADWAWYSVDHPDGIMIECVSQNVSGSKEERLTKDVRNSVHYFTQKHKILVFGGARRFLLETDAIRLLKEERRISRRVAPNSHIVTVDGIGQLLATL